jgi:hypothetical protein
MQIIITMAVTLVHLIFRQAEILFTSGHSNGARLSFASERRLVSLPTLVLLRTADWTMCRTTVECATDIAGKYLFTRASQKHRRKDQETGN